MMARMPRIAPALVVTLLLGVLLHPAPAQTTAPKASAAPIRSATPSTPTMPLRLVRRGASGQRALVGSRYGQPIEFPNSKTPQTDGKRQPLTGDKPARGNVTSVVLSSLAIVLGLFFLVVWLARRALPKSSTSLPADVLEVLGRSPLANRHHLQLIRLGRRLLLITVSPDSAETLTEITDPDEVSHLIGLCQQQQPGSITGSFRQVLHQLGSQPASRSGRSRGATDLEESDAGASLGPRASIRPVREMS